MLTMADARTAFNWIKTAYSDWILPDLKKRTADEVYIFCDEPAFAVYFNITYKSAFKQANSLLIPELITPDQINGFVNAKSDDEERRIFIPKREGIKIGTLAHEAIHYFSHPKFYPQFYCQGGMRPFQVEGATEYLTRKAHSSLRLRQNYQEHYDKTVSWVGGSKEKADKLKGFLFQGVEVNLDAIATEV